MNRTILTTPFIILTAICLFFLIYILLGKNPNDPPSALLNKNLPSFSSINLYDEEEVFLSDSLKGNYTLINHKLLVSLPSVIYTSFNQS